MAKVKKAMILDPKLLIDTLAKHKIDLEQYMLCYLLCTEVKTLSDGTNSLSKTALIYKYWQEIRPWNLKKIGDLVEMGFLVDRNKPDKNGIYESYPDHYEVTQKFKDIVFGDPDDMGEQLWAAYPDIFIMDGKKFPAKTASMGKEELLDYYIRVIKKNKLLHSSILTLVKRLKETDNIQMGIEKWVRNHHWSIELSRLDELTNKGTAHAHRKL